ncbi:wax ester synthase/diacylglycerol acyltransferase 2-like isoform X2 [Wolffia australiana]
MGRNKHVMLSHGEGDIEAIHRKLTSLVLSLKDMKVVKNRVNATINDVFVGIILYGVFKYLESKPCEEASEDSVLTGLIAVNVRGDGSEDILRSIREGKKIKWGNKYGFIGISVALKNNMKDPIEYVRKAKELIDEKKKSSEAQYSFQSNAILTYLFGHKRLASHHVSGRRKTNLLTSNIVGPSNPIKLAGNQISKMGLTLSVPPTAIDIDMISYCGKAFLQLLVAEEIIDELELLSFCVREALVEMKNKVANSPDSAQ